MQKEKKVAAIILAAGNSSRLGTPKQLLVWRGESLIHRTARLALASGYKPVLVVCGAYTDLVEKAIADLEVEVVYNPNWEAGMGTSLKKGLDHLQHHPYDASLLMVCDQPYIDENLLNELIQAYLANPHLAIASAYSGSLGVPVILARDILLSQKLADKHKGARQILKNLSPESVFPVPFPMGEKDIDSREDWENLQKS